jgi:DNA-binding CsgD family transcriptional regulator
MLATRARLAGRDRQLKLLDGLYSSSARRAGWIGVVCGAATTGKTELLQTFLTIAGDRGALVLSAHGAEPERHLPLGVLERLIAGPGVSPAVAGEVTDVVARVRGGWGTDQEMAETAARRVGDVLLAAAGSEPLVVAVDDAQVTDDASLRCLRYLAGHAPAHPLLVLLSERMPLVPSDSVLRAPLPPPKGGLGRICRIPVETLTPAGVAEVLARSTGEPALPSAAHYHALSGGNPLLLHALIEDTRMAGGSAADRPVVGEAFIEAVVGFLYRCDEDTRRVARALAVLGDPPALPDISRVLHLPGALVTRAAHLLQRGGLLHHGRFRHEQARLAALATMSPHARAGLHRDVAEQWWLDGRPATAIAPHLVEAGAVDAAWAGPILREAAEQAVRAGRLEHAHSYARAAYAAPADDIRRAGLAATLARAKWSANPADVRRHLPELAAALQAGRLDGRDAVAVVAYLLWHGRAEKAVDLLPAAQLAALAEPDAEALVHAAGTSLAYLYPVHGRGADPAAAALTALGSCPDVEPPALSVTALLTAAFADRLGSDPRWMEERLQRHCPHIWPAFAAAVRAELALRRGDLERAVTDAGQALTLLEPEGWGVALGWPLATLVRTLTQLDNHQAAAAVLALPEAEPPGLFASPAGLNYVLARGHHYLATNRFQNALHDFQVCADTLATWELDLPELVPWRLGLAETHLRLGNDAKAAELARDQLRLVGPQRLRLRAAALRVLAGAICVDARPAMLRKAADLAEEAGDRLGHGFALADLGAAYELLGRGAEARSCRAAAQRIAQQIGAHALARHLGLDRPRPAADPFGAGTDPGGDAGARALSEAELRVAAVAAQGLTNREIAQRLFLTVSTVEQHLTRAYRKLGITRRTELPRTLFATAPAPAVQAVSRSSATERPERPRTPSFL